MVILRKRVAGLGDAALAKFVRQAGRIVKLRGVVNVLVAGNRELRGLNHRFRGKDRPTDVLSFPPVLGWVDGFAGDVAVSAEMAARNARQLGHSTAEEIKILALHGVLHLAGYDHERDNGEMARKEGRLRKLLGLPAGLIERSRQPTAKSSNRRSEGRPRTQRKAAGGRPFDSRSGQVRARRAPR